MKHIVTRLLFFTFLALPLIGFSQREFNNWFFGDSAGVSFMTGSPVAFLSNKMDAQSGGTCNISDSLGNILFYSNNGEVYNRNNIVMPDGWLNGSIASMSYIKQTIAFQQLNDHSKYYIFYNGLGGSPPGKLRYSVVDMNLDGGLGDIPPAQNGILVPGGARAFHAVAATRHHNIHDVWVVVRLQSTDSNYYSSYFVNSAGLNGTPVFGNSHLLRPAGANWVINCIKISRDGTKLAAIYSVAVEFCNFNSTTGEVTPLFLVYPPKCSNQNLYPISAEFSIDSRYLYISARGGPACSSRYFLYQYDATITDSAQFINSATLLCNENRCHMLELAPDGKIYSSSHYEQTTYPFTVFVDSLCVINNPSSAGTGCNYQKNVLSLQGRGSGRALPDFVERYYALIYDTVHCLEQAVGFASAIWPPPDSIHWNFGDPSSGPANSSLLPNPSHSYSSTGNYTVELFVRHIDKRTDTTWQVVSILLKPNLGPDKLICTSDLATFDAGPCPGCTFMWKDLGSGATMGTSQTFTTGVAGTYTATIRNSNGCNSSDTVQLSTTPVPVIANTPPLSKTICTGESTNIPLTSNPPGATFHWTATLTSGNVSGFSADSGLVINQLLVNALSTPGIVTYYITPKIGSCTGTTLPFPVTVYARDTVKVSISPSANNICSGTTVTFTATPVNPGSSPVYQWKLNGSNTGINSSTYSYIPVNSDHVSCTLTSSISACITNNPATSNTVTMTVNPNFPVSVSISALPNPFCAGTAVNYTATPVNGGSTPHNQWKVNGSNAGTDSPNFSYSPQAGDSIRCVLTSNLACVTNNPASSNRITMTGLPVPAVSFTLCFDSITTITANPIKLKGGIPLGGTYSGPGVNSGTGVFTPSIAGTGTKTITYSYTNVALCSAFKTKNIIVQAATVFSCGNNLVDIRDNKTYTTVQIGTQCWMRKNLNYGTAIQGATAQTDNCMNEKYCYNDDQVNCSIYGGLYQWDEVMAYDNTTASQGLCPPNWHVPSQAEWMTLFNANLTQGLAGKPLQDSIINGFRAIESGLVYSNISWKFQGFATFFWSSNYFGAVKALSHSMNLQNFGVSDYYSNRSNAFAVRCVKN
ncbi:MAG: hypothetical protein NTY96_09140 [Bacteroidetes bacterium]|nr:hypothetical protein [Bacteroidota bacterium]